jgi:hypothetical protein
VLDPTPLYDAVATMDTVTLIRCAVRGLLTAADPGWRGGCGRSCTAALTTPARPSRSSTGTTRPPGRR